MRLWRREKRPPLPPPDLTALRTALDDLDATDGVESSGWQPGHHVRVSVRSENLASVYDLDVIDRWAYLLLHNKHVREFAVEDEDGVRTLLDYLEGAVRGE